MSAMNSENVILKSANGDLISMSEVLQLKVNELKTSFPLVEKEIKNLDVKPGRTRLFSQDVTSSFKQIHVGLKDSIKADSSRNKTFHYADAYYDVDGFTGNDSAHLKIITRDTLIQIVYKGKRIKPWLWIFSKRKLMQRVRLTNPNATIKSSQVIQIQRGNYPAFEQ